MPNNIGRLLVSVRSSHLAIELFFVFFLLGCGRALGH